ncbi:MAG: EsaB/YukD family protein, partial [Pseudonocardiaceae bacterium]
MFSRVTVVAPRTRIDLALPSDVAVANLLPMLLKMAGESSAD